MDARQDIGGGIRPVEETYHPYENIVPVKTRRPQEMSVGIEGGHHKERVSYLHKEIQYTGKIPSGP